MYPCDIFEHVPELKISGSASLFNFLIVYKGNH